MIKNNDNNKTITTYIITYTYLSHTYIYTTTFFLHFQGAVSLPKSVPLRHRPPDRWRRGADGNHHPEATQGALREPRRVRSPQPALCGVPWINLMPQLVVSIKLGTPPKIDKHNMFFAEETWWFTSRFQAYFQTNPVEWHFVQLLVRTRPLFSSGRERIVPPSKNWQVEDFKKQVQGVQGAEKSEPAASLLVWRTDRPWVVPAPRFWGWAPLRCGSAGMASTPAAPWACTTPRPVPWRLRSRWTPPYRPPLVASPSSCCGTSSPRNTTWVACAMASWQARASALGKQPANSLLQTWWSKHHSISRFASR